MWQIFQNIKNLKTTRKILRNNQTKTEQIFWNKVKNKQFHNLKFRRQHSIWRYILDFYIPELKFCIEIDGDSHFDENWKSYDEVRTEFLKSIWIKVIRFTNKDIVENLDWVIELLEKIILKH